MRPDGIRHPTMAGEGSAQSTAVQEQDVTPGTMVQALFHQLAGVPVTRVESVQRVVTIAAKRDLCLCNLVHNV